MSTVISKPNYSTIAYNLADAKNSLKSSNYFLWDNVYTVVNINQIDPEVDLLYVMNNSYQANTVSSSTPQNFLSAVQGLQAHIVKRTGYVATNTQTAIDQYLVANKYGGAIQVPPAFATMSATVGYPISAGNILPTDPAIPPIPPVLP